MNLLLDTHAWPWFHLGDPQLSEIARKHIVDPANTKFVSPASFWEISIKHRDPFDRLLVSQAQAEGMAIASEDAKLAAYGIPIIW